MSEKKKIAGRNQINSSKKGFIRVNTLQRIKNMTTVLVQETSINYQAAKFFLPPLAVFVNIIDP